MAERPRHPVPRIAFAVAIIVLGLAAVETAMRYRNWPRPVISGWRASVAGGPVNQFGWRGQPARRHKPGDFVVVMTGGADVECVSCTPDETLDVILERALQRYNPDARVVTLGSTGYSQDQEYLALHEYFAHQRADLVVSWASIAEDVPGNTFRSGAKRPGRLVLKPTYALSGDDIRGPTEELGGSVYKSKLSGLLRPLVIDVDRNWTTLLPKPDPGAASGPPGAEVVSHVDEPLEQQRSAWAIWLTPRPARVSYGIALTHALLRRMRELATLRGARFEVLLTPPADARGTAPIALEHDGHWFVADPATRDAAIAEVTDGFDTITLPVEAGPATSPEVERQVMERLAEALHERDALAPVVAAGPRH